MIAPKLLPASSCASSTPQAVMYLQRGPAARQLDYKYQQFFKPSNGKENNDKQCKQMFKSFFLCKHREQTPCPVACLFREERCLLRGRFITRRSLFRYVPWLWRVWLTRIQNGQSARLFFLTWSVQLSHCLQQQTSLPSSISRGHILRHQDERICSDLSKMKIHEITVEAPLAVLIDVI